MQNIIKSLEISDKITGRAVIADKAFYPFVTKREFIFDLFFKALILSKQLLFIVLFGPFRLMQEIRPKAISGLVPTLVKENKFLLLSN
ncbi:MAG: hypothetical protein ABFC98_05410 [Candidatus Cloacimonas sp.]